MGITAFGDLPLPHILRHPYPLPSKIPLSFLHHRCNRFLRYRPRMRQHQPDKPIKLIVTYPAGGPTDVIARNVAQKLAEAGLPEFDLNKGFWYAILAPAEARVLIETDTKRWAEVIRANRISLTLARGECTGTRTKRA